jgi:ribosomal protein S18 acetylase RimI-like enzyme
MPDIQIRSLTPSDGDLVKRVMVAEWGAETVVAHLQVFHPVDMPGFVACIGEEPVGLLTYNISGKWCEIVTLNSWRVGLGVGTALIEAVRQAAIQAGCGRLFLVTTNNNTYALRFYQKRGFIISSIRINAIAEFRKLKPQIPLLDVDGLPISDEIELEIRL